MPMVRRRPKKAACRFLAQRSRRIEARQCPLLEGNRTCIARYLAQHPWWDTEKENINTIRNVLSVPLFRK